MKCFISVIRRSTSVLVSHTSSAKRFTSHKNAKPWREPPSYTGELTLPKCAGCRGLRISTFAQRNTLSASSARVCGRSPLEYLSKENRLIQRQIVIEMIKEGFPTVDQVITGFTKKIAGAG